MAVGVLPENHKNACLCSVALAILNLGQRLPVYCILQHELPRNGAVYRQPPGGTCMLSYRVAVPPVAYSVSGGSAGKTPTKVWSAGETGGESGVTQCTRRVPPTQSGSRGSLLVEHALGSWE